MSNLHKIKARHRGMTKKQIEVCNCEFCQNNNVGKTKRRVVPEKSMEDIAREMGIKI